MKKNEIALLLLIVSIVAIATYFIVDAIVGKAAAEPVNVEKAEKFSSQVVTPSDEIFNSNAINPTVKTQIGNQSNQQPFTINQ